MAAWTLSKPAIAPVSVYSAAKKTPPGRRTRANHLRVQAESLRWAERGAGLNTISSGVILTPMAQHELASPASQGYQAMIAASAAKRVGTPEEVAAAAAYLLGPEAGFVTGSDLLIDGGVVAALRMGQLNLPR
ncbi:MAG: SDR family oxidoreductase [Anaerolineales bacterium]|nr:SDR family oxidoreductase [Anaerolineales bacterium]